MPLDSILGKTMHFTAGYSSPQPGPLLDKALAFSGLFSSEFYSLLSVNSVSWVEGAPSAPNRFTLFRTKACQYFLAKKVTDKRKEEDGARSRAHRDGWRFLLLRPQAMAISR